MSDEKDKKEEELDDEDLDLDDEGDDDDLDLDDEDDDLGDDDDADPEKKKDEDAGDDDLTDFSEKDLEDPEKRKLAIEELKKAKSSIKQRAIWKKRAMKAGWKKDQPPKEAPPKRKTAPSKNDETVEEARRLNERTEFRLDHPDIPRRMIDEVQKYANANGMTMEQALRRPLIQKFVNDKELKERLSKASPTSRHRSPQTAPPKDWATATPEEVAAHEAEVRRRANARG